MKAFLAQMYLAAILLVVGLLISCSFMACGASAKSFQVDAPASDQGPPELVRRAVQQHHDLGTSIDAFSEWLNNVPGTSVVNIELVKANFKPIPIAFNAETDALKPLAPAVAKERAKLITTEKERDELKADDPIRFWLQTVGLIAFFVGAIGLGIYFFTRFKPSWLLDFSTVAVFVGSLAFTFVWFIGPIRIVLICTVGVAFLGLLYLVGMKIYKWYKNPGLVPGFLAMVPTKPNSVTATFGPPIIPVPPPDVT